MKVNSAFGIGLVLLLSFCVAEFLCYTFLEIRDESFYKVIQYVEYLFFMLTTVILIISFYKFRQAWKWMLILPLSVFSLVHTSGMLFLSPLPNEITVKEDTEVLFSKAPNMKEKIIVQQYWLGITGDSFISDTVQVYELCELFRISRPVSLTDVNDDWIRNIKK
ncbi:hypothetical protein [Cesiribacter sp. SM1]|uniref:hypothetical protein n=1 Tax=Cesiribacter sp. SM1 TaxID=2861196 RepID=UPI001CD7AED0|nr:hypothetical protein [Cesiribacter sp. SM1]